MELFFVALDHSMDQGEIGFPDATQVGIIHYKECGSFFRVKRRQDALVSFPRSFVFHPEFPNRGLIVSSTVIRQQRRIESAGCNPVSSLSFMSPC